MRVYVFLTIVAIAVVALFAEFQHLDRRTAKILAKLDAVERTIVLPPANLDLSTPEIDKGRLADSQVPYAAPLPFGGQNPIFYKTKVVCSDLDHPRTMVLLALGQSNAANYAGRMSRSDHADAVANYYAGYCYQAEDPLLGATGDGGSLWPELANRLISAGEYDRVIIIPFAVGGTSLARWTPDGDLNAGLVTLLKNLALAKISPTHVFWIQGEAETYAASRYNTDGPAYARDLKALLGQVRAISGAVPTFVSLASSCPNQERQPGPLMPIREAQLSLISKADDIHLGADLDGITDFADRYDGCHLTATGATRVVDQLFSAVVGHKLDIPTMARANP